MRSEVGRRVRLLRRDVRGMTLGELANGVGVSRSYLEKIEAGRRDPSMGLCDRAARVLGVRLSELVGNGAAGGNGVVLETVARLRGLGVDPGALSAWLARRPCPVRDSEQECLPSAGTMPPSTHEEDHMSTTSGRGDGKARRAARKLDRFSVALGRRIARLRRARKPVMTQDALAARIGVTRTYLSKLERGEMDLPISLASRMASVLRVPIGKLISDDGRDVEAEEWHRVALEACRAFSGLGMKPEEAAPSIRWLTSLLASYVRRGTRHR